MKQLAKVRTIVKWRIFKRMQMLMHKKNEIFQVRTSSGNEIRRIKGAGKDFFEAS